MGSNADNMKKSAAAGFATGAKTFSALSKSSGKRSDTGVSYQGGRKKAATGFTLYSSQDNNQDGGQDTGNPGTTIYTGGGGGYRRTGGGGSRSSSGSTTPEEQQKQTQAQINNTGGVYQRRLGDINANVAGRKNDLDAITKDRLGDIDKNSRDQLENIKQQQQANAASLATNRRNIMQGIDWQPNQQKEQSTMMALRNRMGNSAYGSAIQDLGEGMARVDDMNDYQLISTWKQNENNAYANWYQAEQGLIGDWNDQITQINDEISQYEADYRDQMSKLRADYNDETSKLFSQYWSAMSNINPELATRENIDKAAKGGDAAARAKQQKVSDAVAKMTKTMTGKKAKKVDTKGLDSTQKAAAKIINDAIKKNSKTSEVVKTATEEAKKALEKAGKVKVGEGTDEYYLPNTPIWKRADLSKDLDISPSKALQKMLVRQGNASSLNPRTASYVRPDRGAGDVVLGKTKGQIDNSRAANSGFSDNLAAFRRV